LLWDAYFSAHKISKLWSSVLPATVVTRDVSGKSARAVPPERQIVAVVSVNEDAVCVIPSGTVQVEGLTKHFAPSLKASGVLKLFMFDMIR
jgi:hypothetical protein